MQRIANIGVHFSDTCLAVNMQWIANIGVHFQIPA
jgi:hypothetical protein